jgi:hypothetical protein
MRDQLIEFFKRELVGPDPVPPLVQENGEEILVSEPPRLRYGAGILFPQDALVEGYNATNSDESDMMSDTSMSEASGENPGIEFEEQGGVEIDDSNDETINLANAQMPSAMGFSCFLDLSVTGLHVKVIAGRYRVGDAPEERPERDKKRRAYFRESIEAEIDIQKDAIPDRNRQSRNFNVQVAGEPTGLLLNVRYRATNRMTSEGGGIYTFTLVNSLKSDGGRAENDKCFFQVEFCVRATDGSDCFFPYPLGKANETEDDRSAKLLYRNHRTFAIGHGCATSWREGGDGRACEIRTQTVPVYETKPILPSSFPKLELGMYEMSDYGDQSMLSAKLEELCDLYEAWIGEQEIVAAQELDDEFRAIAGSHIENCRRCLKRMREGIELIKGDARAKHAFRLMNRAMLTQQISSNMKLREWILNDGNIELERIPNPDIHDRTTWPYWPEKRLGLWRPFQIAFILMNLRSITLPDDRERGIIDVIWFPSGGGKTEAYLGLTAYTIFLKRLRDRNDSGTTVLMRYTLRLLTADQFQRAASLICSCEMIRRENSDELGNDRITIGLWAGGDLTPNKRADAITAFNKIVKGDSEENPFLILKCPWCGAQMGPIRVNKAVNIKGYMKQVNPSTIVFRCHNEGCDFSSTNLPLLVIDEDIYESPPSLVIGTVDKFAILPWKPESGILFGFRQGNRVSPPELIIQDELHLISGPLGSMVGHYETLISELCKNERTGVGAKVIASTATISRAKEQVHALYNCGQENVFLFPPQCLNAGDSFFAHVSEDAPGRIYLGVHASALPSNTTTLVRVFSALFQAAKFSRVDEERERNPYWTLVNYFNSLRELGHAATLLRADIREYLNAMWVRKGIRKEGGTDQRRFINRAIELTSRISSSEIARARQALEFDYPKEAEKYPIDTCLATNMISVGIDIPRLGLMIVVGQPKTTSEYIQTTSRVGRSSEGPGLVAVIYNTSRPRDRSHYEHFESYHARIYSQVEPTSVTPFSTQVRERALHALLVGFVRLFGSARNKLSPQPFPEKGLFRMIEDVILKRIDGIDPDEKEPTLRLLKERIDEWSRYLPSKYGDFAPPTIEPRLMFPAGSTPLEEWGGRAWPTPTSMRNVDASCEAQVIKNYLVDEE